MFLIFQEIFGGTFLENVEQNLIKLSGSRYHSYTSKNQLSVGFLIFQEIFGGTFLENVGTEFDQTFRISLS